MSQGTGVDFGDVATWVGSAMGAIAFIYSAAKIWLDGRPSPPVVEADFRPMTQAESPTAAFSVVAIIRPVDSRNALTLKHVTAYPAAAGSLQLHLLNTRIEDAVGLAQRQQIIEGGNTLAGNWLLPQSNPLNPKDYFIAFQVTAPADAFSRQIGVNFTFEQRGKGGYSGTVQLMRQLTPGYPPLQ